MNKAILLFNFLICLGSSVWAQSAGNQLRLDSALSRLAAEENIFIYFKQSDVENIVVPFGDTTSLSGLMQLIRSDFNLQVYEQKGRIFISSKMDLSRTLSFRRKPIVQTEATEKADDTKTTSQEADFEDLAPRQTQNQEVIFLGDREQPQDRATLTGYLSYEDSGEPLVGATIWVKELEKGTITDAYGFYTLRIPSGQYMLEIKSIDARTVEQEIIIYSDATFDFEMREKVTRLDEVVVESNMDNQVNSTQMGRDKIEIKTIKYIPASMGEVDIVKTAILLPGVQTVGEGASGFNVRGGSTDQNLVLYDRIPIFNTSHLFGFFSAFNAEVINDFSLYKAGIPARYGSRLSSVFDISTINGNKKKYNATIGVSPITGKISAEGPIIKDKASFVVGGRTTYSNWLLRQINDQRLRESEASFYDLNGKIHYQINKNNELSISGYQSNDFFDFGSDTVYSYSSRGASASWRKVFSKNLYGVFSGVYSQYNYSVANQNNPQNAFDLSFGINYYSAGADFSYFPSNGHQIEFGLQHILYDVNPGSVQPLGEGSLVTPENLQQESAFEDALYGSYNWEINPNMNLEAGLRYSFFTSLGPRTIYEYASGLPLEPRNIVDSTYFQDGRLINLYDGLEPRLSFRYKINKSNSVKASYNRVNQYLHMLSNTVAISPTDTWKLSDPNIRPQIGDQVSLGYYKNLFFDRIELSGEVYYKWIQNSIFYKGGAQLIMNDLIETELIQGQGRAYGFEFLLKKKQGRLNGWLAYTYSRSLVRANGDSPVERINNGELFPASFDKPHDLTLVSNFKFNRRISLSNNFTYSTGRPITYPVAQFRFGDSNYSYYTDINQERIPDFIRWDMSVNLEGNLKEEKWAHTFWSLSVYNMLGRFNVYSVYFVSEGGNVNGYQLSIFAQPIVTLSFNVRLNR